MNDLLELLRSTIALGFGVTMTDTNLTVRHETGIANFVLVSIQEWDAEECNMCGGPGPFEKFTLTIQNKHEGNILEREVPVCADCWCPK